MGMGGGNLKVGLSGVYTADLTDCVALLWLFDTPTVVGGRLLCCYGSLIPVLVTEQHVPVLYRNVNYHVMPLAGSNRMVIHVRYRSGEVRSIHLIANSLSE
jgi:hypothetical protein